MGCEPLNGAPLPQKNDSISILWPLLQFIFLMCLSVDKLTAFCARALSQNSTSKYTQNGVRKQGKGAHCQDKWCRTTEHSCLFLCGTFFFFFGLPSSSQNQGISQGPPFTVKLQLQTTRNMLLIKRTVITLLDDLNVSTESFFVPPKEQEKADY